MNRQPLRTLSVLLFPLVTMSLGCSDDEPIESADESTETGDSTDSTDSGDSSDEGNSSESGDSSDEGPDTGGDNEGPSVELMLDGDTLPPALESASELHLQAEAEDPSGISMVEFYLDDQLISSDASEPYAASVVIPDASSNGEHSLTARAYDSLGNMAESTIPLSVDLPESGTVEWEYFGAGDGQRWVSVGAEDSALVVGKDSMVRISAEGAMLSEYSFTFDAAAATTSEDGGVIVLGATNGTLVIQQFADEGLATSFELIQDFGDPGMSISQVVLADGGLLISSVNAYDNMDTARLSKVTLGDDPTLAWHKYMVRNGQPTSFDRTAHVAVAPSGAIYTTPTFQGGEYDVFLQLRRVEADGDAGPITEDFVNYRWRYNDIVATDESVFIAARWDADAVIRRFDANGEPDAMYFLGADKATVLEPVDDGLIYAAVMDDDSTKLGRISMDGDERWSTQFGGGDIVHDIAVTSVGHMYVVSEWDPQAWRLRRVHP